MIALIWAQAKGRVIGKDGAIPWRVPEDQEQFKRRTMGATVLMGRRTWESLPASVRPLPGRRNLVLTSNPGWTADGAERVESVEAAIRSTEGDLWVIGGAEVYEAAMPYADHVLVTFIDLECSGDAFAPALGPEWRPAFESDWQTSTSGLRYEMKGFQRAPAIPSMP